MSYECATKAQRSAKQAAAKSDCVRGRAVVRKLPAFAELVDVGARAIKMRLHADSQTSCAQHVPQLHQPDTLGVYVDRPE